MRPATDVGDYVGGLVAAEGHFACSGRRFALAVELGARDARSCELLALVLGVGKVYRYARRQPHHDDVVAYRVQRLRDLVDVIVPFMDEHLPPSYKRVQYGAWRALLLDHWEHPARPARRRRERGS